MQTLIPVYQSSATSSCLAASCRRFYSLRDDQRRRTGRSLWKNEKILLMWEKKSDKCAHHRESDSVMSITPLRSDNDVHSRKRTASQLIG